MEELRSQIMTLVPQRPPSHRSESHKIVYLSEAVLGHSLADVVITQSVSAVPQ